MQDMHKGNQEKKFPQKNKIRSYVELLSATMEAIRKWIIIFKNEKRRNLLFQLNYYLYDDVQTKI